MAAAVTAAGVDPTIRVVLFDLALTLVDWRNQPQPNVVGAVRAITALTADDGRPVRWALVASPPAAVPPTESSAEPTTVTPATPPAGRSPAPSSSSPSAALVRDEMQACLSVLDGAGLRSLFEPAGRRVTIAAQAGVVEPDRALFELALRRLRTTAGFDRCLYISGDETHLAAAGPLGLATLRFGADGAAGAADWSQAPALVAARVGPERDGNRQIAVAAHLAAHGFQLDQLTPAADAVPSAPATAAAADVADATAGPDGADGTGTGRAVFDATGQLWHPLAASADPAAGDRAGEGGPLHVAVPARGRVEVVADGTVAWLPEPPSPDDVREAENWVSSLTAHGQLATDADPSDTATSPDELPAGATHRVEVDAEGRRCLVRRRFSAF